MVVRFDNPISCVFPGQHFIFGLFTHPHPILTQKLLTTTTLRRRTHTIATQITVTTMSKRIHTRTIPRLAQPPVTGLRLPVVDTRPVGDNRSVGDNAVQNL